MAIRSTTPFNHDEFDSIQVNFNEAMPPHKDKLNRGPSLCLAVGNFSGGELVIDEPSGRKLHNIKGRLLRYNGHHTHSVNPFYPGPSGNPAERFSFVLYKRKSDHLKPNTPINSICLQLETALDAKGTEVVIEEAELADLRKIAEDQRPKMMDAILKEVHGLIALGTFTLEPMPRNHRPIDSRLVLKVKYKADGSYDKHKARLVARGFLARLGVDFYSTFSPMASLTAVRIMCSLALTMNYSIMHSDIPQAFIQSKLDSDHSWMSLPRGISLRDKTGKGHKIVKLRRALYGLRQSPQLWNKALTKYFTKTCELKRGKSETSFYYKHVDGKFLLVLSEVDDLVYTGHSDLVKEFEAGLKRKWNISETGKLKSFLGINIHHEEKAGTITFDVEDKTNKLFEERDWLSGIGNSSLPMHPNPKKKVSTSCSTLGDYERIRDKLTDPKTFASVVGACIYMSITCRPDISHTVGRIPRAMHAPTEGHIDQCITLLQYLHTTSRHKLKYYAKDHPVNEQFKLYSKKNSDLRDLVVTQPFGKTIEGNQICGMSDADYASVLEDEKKSTSGFCFFFRQNLVCWRSKLQPILATSTHEAELIAMNIAAQEAVWLRNFLAEVKAAITGKALEQLVDDTPEVDIHLTDLDSTKLLCDNMGTCHSAMHPVSSKRSKHIDIRYWKIREYQEQRRLTVRHIDGDKNPADMFTKALPKDAFGGYLRLIGMQKVQRKI